MPKDKDLKKLVRARVAKTGERYSIAKLRLAGAGKPQSASARPSSASLEGSAAPAIYQAKITLSEIAPSIWRRLLVPADTSLVRLHHIIQAAFGWLNYHLHQYITDEWYFGDPDPEFAGDLPPRCFTDHTSTSRAATPIVSEGTRGEFLGPPAYRLARTSSEGQNTPQPPVRALPLNTRQPRYAPLSTLLNFAQSGGAGSRTWVRRCRRRVQERVGEQFRARNRGFGETRRARWRVVENRARVAM